MPSPLLRPINWSYISQAVQFYALRGYQHVEVPWIIPHAVIMGTAPAWVTPLATPEGDLVGSGEQGLLHMALQGRLTPGRYQTTTPCWRDDPEDELHGRHFVKVELMILKANPTPEDRDAIMTDAKAFYDHFLSTTRLVVDLEPHQVDIICDETKIELGSYGVRRFLHAAWAYGTGCAEPRLSTVLARRGSLPARPI